MEPPRKQPPRSWKGSSNANITKHPLVSSSSSGNASSRSSKPLKGKKFDKTGISSVLSIIKGKTVNSTEMQSNHGSSQLKSKSGSVESSSQSPSSSLNTGKDRVLDEALMKLRSFKQFDTVDNHSDHHYAAQKGHSMTQAPKTWAKRIQKEWKILEKDLPDTILVRVYESRMDILRAVIKGADGTPYHDGLFFFDVFFPSDFPNVPPHVYYRAGGLRLNPNLYACGKVCLSLLNTWSGSKDEKWIPEKSTMLQVLVSIQGLILNSKPYFNEPAYETSRGIPHWETRSLEYNESTFILSLRTMSFTMRKPPKHFEELVAGHFCERAHDILVACEAYMDGAQVGRLVKGRVQDLGEGDKSCSDDFKKNVASYIKVLVTDLKSIGAILTDRKSIGTIVAKDSKSIGAIGAKDSEKFLDPAKTSSKLGAIGAKDSEKFLGPAKTKSKLGAIGAKDLGPAKTRSKGAGVKIAIVVMIFVLFVPLAG